MVVGTDTAPKSVWERRESGIICGCALVEMVRR